MRAYAQCGGGSSPLQPMKPWGYSVSKVSYFLLKTSYEAYQKWRLGELPIYQEIQQSTN
jgi:hypothetical protein